MSDISLRLPYLIYLSIGSMFLGVLLAPAFRDVGATPAAEPASMMMHEHGRRDVPAEGAPHLTMIVERDPMQGWNITLETENFTFAPRDVGGVHIPNIGHAHLYINGEKVARLYGPHFHIPDMAPGQYEIAVSLSTNDHAYFVVDGALVEARAMIMQASDMLIED